MVTTAATDSPPPGQDSNAGAVTVHVTPPTIPVVSATPAAQARTYVSPGDLDISRDGGRELDCEWVKRGVSLVCSLVQSGSAVSEFVLLSIQLGRLWPKLGNAPYCENGWAYGNALGMGSDWTKAGIVIVLIYCGYLVISFVILVVFKSQVPYMGGPTLMQTFRDSNLLCSMKLNLLATDMLIFLHFHQAIGFLSFISASSLESNEQWPDCIARGPMSWSDPKIDEALPLCLLFLVMLRVVLECCYYEQSTSGPGFQDVQRTTCCCIRTRVVTTAEGQVVQQSPVSLVLGYLDWVLHLWGFFFALTVAVGKNPYRITYMTGAAATLVGGVLIAVF